MDQPQALLQLGLTGASLPTTEQLRDAYEEAIYQAVQALLTRPFVPQLSHARKRKLTAIGKAAYLLGLDLPEVVSDPELQPYLELPQASLLQHFSGYQQYVAQVRRRLASSSDHREAGHCITHWHSSHLQYALHFTELYHVQYPHTQPDASVKLSAGEDSQAIWNELSSPQPGPHTLAHYSRLLLSLREPAGNSSLQRGA